MSNSDTCRSRMAQEILNSFGRGMKISTAGVLVGNSVPDVVCQVMEQNGYDFSRRKPCDVATYTQQTWDYVITLCPEAEEVQKEMQGVVRKYVSFNFADPFQGGIHTEDEQEERVVALYDACLLYTSRPIFSCVRLIGFVSRIISIMKSYSFWVSLNKLPLGLEKNSILLSSSQFFKIE